MESKVNPPQPPEGFHPCPYGEQLWYGAPYCSWANVPNDKGCTFDLCRQIYETDREGNRLVQKLWEARSVRNLDEEKRFENLIQINSVLREELMIRQYNAHGLIWRETEGWEV